MQGPRPFLVHGVWKHSAATARVTNPFTGNVIAEVCLAGESDAEEATASSVAAAPVMAKLASHARYNILQEMAALLYRRRDEFAQTITAEAGKPIADAKREVNRAVQTLTIAAEEAKRIPGEVVPLDWKIGRAHV